MKAEYLSAFSAHIVASPAYLAESAALLQPSDLANHRFLAYGRDLNGHLAFVDETIALRAISCSNSGIYLRDAVIAGQGLASLPSFFCLI